MILPFLSTLSLRRATISREISLIRPYDFYPRSPCGERLQGQQSTTQAMHFYPRSPCGERPAPQQENGQAATISIHALLAESDRHYLVGLCRTLISIHALLAESDPVVTSTAGVATKFLSTLSLRRAT